MIKEFSLFIVILSLTSAFLSAVPVAPEDSVSDQYRSQQIYLFGGKDENSKRTGSVSHYNITTGAWERTTGMSVSKDVTCGAVFGTNIYLFGGISDAKKTLETAEVFDCETRTYHQYQSLDAPRRDCAAAELDGYIYVSGGINTAAFSSVIRYNVHTNRRENVASMRQARTNHQLVQLNGRLYAIGGGTTGKSVEKYDPATNQWTMIADTKFEHSYFGAAAHEGKIFVLSQTGFEMYSPDTDKWSTLPALSDHRGRSLVSMDGKLWALGGGNIGKDDGTKSVFTYNINTKKWTQEKDMDAPRAFQSAFVVYH